MPAPASGVSWRSYWRPGRPRGGVSARNAEKLEELVRLHPGIVAAPVDVTDAASVAAAYACISRQIGPIDLAVLNAGTWDPMEAGDYAAARAMRSMAVNYGGIANALEPLLADMIARQSGHLALVASVAGYRGLPKAAAYAPSKAAVISLAEVLRLDLARHGVDVSLVNPGFVDTPMTAVNTFPMPFKLSAQDAAQRIVAGLDRAQVRDRISLAARLRCSRSRACCPTGCIFPMVRPFIARR